MKPVCPRCFNEMEDGHICGSDRTPYEAAVERKTTTGGQAAIERQSVKRKRYTHDGLELHNVKLTIEFDIDYVNEFDKSWLLEFLNVRLEVPEGPEDYPTVEDFYIKGVQIRGL
jgi:hypothetical protein